MKRLLSRLLLTAMVGATVGVVGAGQAAQAASVNCPPDIINTTVQTDVNVPSGTCTIKNSTVNGKVTVQPGASLNIFGSTIQGSVTANHPGLIQIDEDVARIAFLGIELEVYVAASQQNAAELAERSHLSEGHISQILRGKTHPREATLQQLADALRVDLDVLLGATDAEEEVAVGLTSHHLDVLTIAARSEKVSIEGPPAGRRARPIASNSSVGTPDERRSAASSSSASVPPAAATRAIRTASPEAASPAARLRAAVRADASSRNASMASAYISARRPEPTRGVARAAAGARPS